MAGKLLLRTAQIASKIEGAEGTAEALDAADANHLIEEPSFNPDIPFLNRNPSRSSLTPLEAIAGRKLAEITFRNEMKGSGVIGDAPSWGRLLKSALFTETATEKMDIGAVSGGPYTVGETITGGTSSATGRVIQPTTDGDAEIFFETLTGVFQSGEVLTGGDSAATCTSSSAPAAGGFEYVPNSDNTGNSLTMALYRSGLKQLIFGARSSFSMAMNVSEPGFFNFNTRGVYGGVTDAALLSSVNYEETIPPKFEGAQCLWGTNTALIINSFNLDWNNTLAERSDACAANGVLSVLVTGREPSGNLDPEMELVATDDFYGDMVGQVLNNLRLILGTVEANVVRLDFPKMQIKNVTQADRAGIWVAQLDLALVSQSVDTGDNEMVIQMQ